MEIRLAMNAPSGGTASQWDLLREILATVGDRIDRMALFRSKTTALKLSAIRRMA